MSLRLIKRSLRREGGRTEITADLVGLRTCFIQDTSEAESSLEVIEPTVEPDMLPTQNDQSAEEMKVSSLLPFLVLFHLS